MAFRHLKFFINLNLNILVSYHAFCFFSQVLASNAVIAKVNGELWDLDRPLEGDCTLELLAFDNEEAKAVSKHSGFCLIKETNDIKFIAALSF